MKFFSNLKMGLRYAWASITLPHFVHKMRKQKKDDEVIICLAPHLGDIVYSMLYAEQYKKENGKKICVFCADNLIDYIKKYNFIDRIITFPRNSLNFEYVSCFPFLRYMKRKKGNFDGIIATMPSACEFKGLNVVEIYRDYIFNVKHDVYNLYPREICEVNAIENFEQNKDKIVILNPYSFSHKTNLKLFEDIAKSLQERGYIVYTNVITKLNQKVVKGTLPFDTNIYEIYSIVDQIPLFVSVRSGILDMNCSGNGNLFALYFKNKSKRHYFSIKYLHKNSQEYFWNSKKDNQKVVNAINMYLDEIENKNKAI